MEFIQLELEKISIFSYIYNRYLVEMAESKTGILLEQQ